MKIHSLRPASIPTEQQAATKAFVRLDFPTQKASTARPLQRKQISHLTPVKDPAARRWGPSRLATYQEELKTYTPTSLTQHETKQLF